MPALRYIALPSLLGVGLLLFLAKRRQRIPIAERRRILQEKAERWQQEFAEVPHITPQQLHEELQAGRKVVLVDVRNPEERRVSRLPGLVVTPEQYEQQQQQYKDHEVVTYCTAGYRSAKYARQLLQAGTPARNLMGSILGWTQAGLPLVAGGEGGGPTRRVHTYGPDWALQGEGYTAVWYHSGRLRPLVDLAKQALGALRPRRRRRQQQTDIQGSAASS